MTAAAATAGRLFGTAVAKARESGAPLAAARGLGRTTGHARRIGRAAAATKTASSAPVLHSPGADVLATRRADPAATGWSSPRGS